MPCGVCFLRLFGVVIVNVFPVKVFFIVSVIALYIVGFLVYLYALTSGVELLLVPLFAFFFTRDYLFLSSRLLLPVVWLIATAS